ncbi:nuclease-related domain-containing protein [Neobacillus sp. FSL H8-0543]|uniref:nuclease-related domain-containing protein n=1 Tax=Neobacillus sp. FSL H8-0543 TaxID=2954672 RepID=UPI003158B17B
MAFKSRTESLELRILRILNTRMELSEECRKNYSYLEKGYAGEVQFDLLTEELESTCLILNDLLLEINGTKFQIDTLIIFQETIYQFEVKNYEGDYCYDEESFQTFSGQERKNPFDQLKRSKSLLRQLNQTIGYNLPIEGYVVFINPEFALFQTPKNLPIIFPGQLNRFMKKLNKKQTKLNSWHTKLAERLVSLHIVESPYGRLPPYEYDKIKKGGNCKKCSSFALSVHGKKLICNDCGCEESIESAVLRSVNEIKLLFPDRKITTKEVHEWCQVVESKKRIARILERNFKIKGFGQWAFYE